MGALCWSGSPAVWWGLAGIPAGLMAAIMPAALITPMIMVIMAMGLSIMRQLSSAADMAADGMAMGGQVIRDMAAILGGRVVSSMAGIRVEVSTGVQALVAVSTGVDLRVDLQAGSTAAALAAVVHLEAVSTAAAVQAAGRGIRYAKGGSCLRV